MYEDLTIRDFLNWLAVRDMRVVKDTDGVVEPVDPSALLARWKEEMDS